MKRAFFGFAFAILCLSVPGNIVVGFPGLEGFFLSGPSTVSANDSVVWSVSVTNPAPVETRIRVATTADAVLYTGKSVARLFLQVATNQIPPFASETVEFSIDPGWVPSNVVSFASVELVASAKVESSGEFSAIWIRSDFEKERPPEETSK